MAEATTTAVPYVPPHDREFIERIQALPSGVQDHLKKNRAELHRQIGARYMRCRLSNYRTGDHPGQAEALEQARRYAINLRRFVQGGRGLVFFGSAGTGKDHLLAALANVAQCLAIPVVYRSGPELLMEFRQAMKQQDAELRLLRELTAPPVLWISDPVPPGGKLTTHQAEMLFAVIDGRYRAKRATWVSCNVSSRDEANTLLTVPIADRLRDGSAAVHFNWPSYRRPAGELGILE